MLVDRSGYRVTAMSHVHGQLDACKNNVHFNLDILGYDTTMHVICILVRPLYVSVTSFRNFSFGKHKEMPWSLPPLIWTD